MGLTIGILIFGIIGVLLLYFSITGFKKKQEKFKNARKVAGTVAELREEYKSDGSVYYSTIEFKDESGDTCYWESDVGKYPPDKIGKIFNLQISENGDISADSFFSKYFGEIVMLIVGVGFLFFTILMINSM